MKQTIYMLSLLLSVLMVSCQMENADMGFLMLDLSSTTTTTTISTRALPENYNPTRWAVEIVNSANEVVAQTDNAADWTDNKIQLRAGRYTVKVHSSGWDGRDSGRDNPYYGGETKVLVKAGELVTAKVTCTLNNVKVTVRFDNSMVNAFTMASVTMQSSIANVNDIMFNMTNANTLKPAYFPVGDLTAVLTVINKAGDEFTMSTPITGVKARDHYILNYKTSDSGTGKFIITADDTEKTYTYDFSVPTKSSTTLVANAANPWSYFAYVTGSIPVAAITIANQYVSFQYKKASDSDWTTVAATFANATYSATLSNLTPNTAYSYKLVYNDGGNNVYSSAEQSFTTEPATLLPNGNLDNWYTPSGKYPYACTQSEYNAGTYFWDNSNAGSSMLNKVVTSGIENGRNGMAAKLASAKVLSTIAAASLYVGRFGETNLTTQTATVNFGRPFSARPSSLRGYFKYSTSSIDVKGKNAPSGVPDRDLWSCYWAIMTEGFTFDNGNIAGTSIDWANDERVIAYGSMPDNQCIETNEWTAFEVPLTYRTIKKPANLVLVLVFSASKYGDYMTGSTSSVLCLDDLELVYGEPTLAN